jgi:leucyl aminopeptidase (aminopeptidase T)
VRLAIKNAHLTDEHRTATLASQARLVVSTLLGVREGEQLAIVVDADTERPVLDALLAAVAERGADATILSMPARDADRRNELGPVIERALEGADCLIGLTRSSGAPSYAGAVSRLCAEGRLRYLSMVMRGMDHFTGGGALADYAALRQEGETLAERWRRATRIRVTTPRGTDLRAACSGEEVIVECGFADRPGGRAAFQDGEVSQMPTEGTASGRIVVDGPVAHLGAGGLLTIHVADGRVSAVEGTDGRAEALRDLLANVERLDNVAEIGLGLNPAGRRNGDFQEEKKSRGRVHVALGDNLFYGGTVQCGLHVDMVLYGATLWLDDDVVVRDGVIGS